MRHSMRRGWWLVCAIAASAAQLCAQRQIYFDEIKRSAERGWRENPALVEQWKKTARPNVLWGYDAPAHPVYLASSLAFLYGETGARIYAERAAQLLSGYGDLRETLPAGYAATRAEYAGGVPALSNFFYLPPYVRAYLRIRDSGVLDAHMKAKIEKEVAESVDFIFRFPEWGAHNRAMLRAEALCCAAIAMPDHPRAGKWRQMAEVLAGDSLRHWEIEDTSLYAPIWLLALFSYAEAAGRPDVWSSPVIRYTLQYLARLIAPSGVIPDFGDAWWNSSADGLRLTAVFEKGAAVFRDPELKWAAQSIYRSARRRDGTVGVVEACALADAWRWADESLAPSVPRTLSQEVLEDVVGKKIVFRNGWEAGSTYCLLNYRDEGDGAWTERRYLRQTLSVEEEKMHHGHADENSIVLLMHQGAPLLHDAGYRDDLPSGAFGAWRQDYFHNRLVARKNKRDRSQPLLEFLRNSGAYRPVRTCKIDFLNLQRADMSRTRLIDEELGYEWDRSITYVRSLACFVVVDAVRILRPDYFTFASLWHAQKVLARGEHFFDVATDSLPGFAFPESQALLVYFPEIRGKAEGEEPISRHAQAERMIFQTVSSQYKAGDLEVFVTVLQPHDRSTDARRLLDRFRPMATSPPDRGTGLEIRDGASRHFICVKLDLESEAARENIRPRYTWELGRAAYGDIETDAHYLFATAEAEKFSYGAANLLKLLYRGRTVLEALPNTFGLQLDGGPDRTGYAKWRLWEDTVPAR